jgi:hypothetical protein
VGCRITRHSSRRRPTSQQPPRSGSPRTLPKPVRNRRGPGRRLPRCRLYIPSGGCRDRTRKPSPMGPREAACRCGSRSCRRARPHSRRASIRREPRESGGGKARAWALSKRYRAPGTIPLPIGACAPPVHMIKLTETRGINPRLALQNPRLLDHPREVRGGLFVDGRRLRLTRPPDFRHPNRFVECARPLGRNATVRRRNHSSSSSMLTDGSSFKAFAYINISILDRKPLMHSRARS